MSFLSIREQLLLDIEFGLSRKYGLSFVSLPERARIVRRLDGESADLDIATEVAFSLAKQLKKAPVVIAGEIKEFLSQNYTHRYKSVEVAGKGFINISLQDDYLVKKTITQHRLMGSGDYFEAITYELEDLFQTFLSANEKSPSSKVEEALEQQTVSSDESKDLEDTREEAASGEAALSITEDLSIPKKRKLPLLIEYVSANPTGPLHVGAGRWAVLGDSIGRLMRRMGVKTYCEYYVNDGGNQIKQLNLSVECIRKGLPVPDEGYQGEYLQAFKDNADDPVRVILDGIKQTLKATEAHFDNYFSEMSLRKKGEIEKIIAFLKDSDLAYEKDGALWFASMKGGDDKDRVLVKSDGEYTYFLVDVAYHASKINRGYHHLLDILGADHHGYINRIKAAVAQIFKAMHGEQKEWKFDTLVGQQVMLLRGGVPLKMSKRKGEFVTLEQVLREVGKDAFRYYMLSQDTNSVINFDLEVAKEKSMNNPVYYLQYAHARCHSLIKNAMEKSFGTKVPKRQDFSLMDLGDVRIRRILVSMLWFADELKMIANSYEIHHLPRYLYKVCSLFHSLYGDTKMIDFSNDDSKNISTQYLFLVEVFQNFLKQGLDILGISAPTRMSDD